MRFPPVLVFSSIHPISKIFVAALRDPGGVQAQTATKIFLTRFDTGQCSEMWYPFGFFLFLRSKNAKFYTSLNSNLCQVEVQQFVGIVSCKTRPCSANHFYTKPDVQQQNMPRYLPPCRSISALLQSILGGLSRSNGWRKMPWTPAAGDVSHQHDAIWSFVPSVCICSNLNDINFYFHALALVVLYIFSVDVVSFSLCPKRAACGPTGSTSHKT